MCVWLNLSLLNDEFWVLSFDSISKYIYLILNKVLSQ